MSTELQKALDNLQWHDPYFGEWSVEKAYSEGWELAKRRIISILEDELMTEERENPGGRTYRVVKYIDFADKVIEKIENEI